MVSIFVWTSDLRIFFGACVLPCQATYSPVMGDYLTYKRNRAFDSDGVYPDENYAREIMQLLLSPGDFTWDVVFGRVKISKNREATPRNCPAVGHLTGWTIDVLDKSTAFTVSTFSVFDAGPVQISPGAFSTQPHFPLKKACACFERTGFPKNLDCPSSYCQDTRDINR